MIKCKVTLAGVVNKAATTHAGKDNKPFVSFSVILPLGGAFEDTNEETEKE